MVVLHKGRNSMLSANRVAEGFHEKAARVAETLGFENQYTGHGGWNDIHNWASLSVFDKIGQVAPIIILAKRLRLLEQFVVIDPFRSPCNFFRASDLEPARTSVVWGKSVSGRVDL